MRLCRTYQVNSATFFLGVGVLQATPPQAPKTNQQKEIEQHQHNKTQH